MIFNLFWAVFGALLFYFFAKIKWPKQMATFWVLLAQAFFTLKQIGQFGPIGLFLEAHCDILLRRSNQNKRQHFVLLFA